MARLQTFQREMPSGKFNEHKTDDINQINKKDLKKMHAIYDYILE